MLYRIVAVFNPGHPRLDGTSVLPWKRKHHRQATRLRRGAWRVVVCRADPIGRDVFTEQGYLYSGRGSRRSRSMKPCRMLYCISDRAHKPGTLFNPAAALNRALAVRRNNGQAA